MKTWTRAFALLLLAAALPALAVVMPMRIPFQGKLVDPATNNPKNGPVPMVFKIWDAPTGGNQLFTENQTVTAVNGVFSAQIGTVTYLNADMLSGTSAYLGITVVGDAEMLPRQPLSMSPYAYTAVQLASDKVIRVNSGVTYSTFTTDGNLTLQYGVAGTTATFATIASTGINTYNIVTSSGINMGAGTLKLDPDSRGLDASGTGITASTGVFTSSVTAKQFFGIGATTAAIKAADLSRANTVILADDNELAIPIGANESYTAYALFKSSSGSATPDFKFAFTVPAGGSFDFGCHANNATAASANMFAMRDSGIASPNVAMGVAIIQPIICVGSIVNGATAGFFKLQWAQNTTSGTATTLTGGSFIAATRIK